MRRNGMGQKFLLFSLTVAMILSMYNLTALAEAETPEITEKAELPEAPEVSEKSEVTGEPEVFKEPEIPEESEELDESEEAEEPEKAEMPETPETLTMSENLLTVSGNALMVNENSLTDIDPIDESGMASGLEDSVLKDHIIPGRNSEQAKVNLFDYWQVERDGREYVWDWEENESGMLCDMGISSGHLLRFGLTKEEDKNKPDLNYGAWNMYSVEKPYQGIVQNTLGADGFPRLNFEGKEGEFGNYAKKPSEWFVDGYKTESLAYLFSVTKQNSYKAIYENVQGLFQMDQEGYYYYDSRENFAEFDKANSRFILYDSPGVGTKDYYGQFFPFNKASDVFDTVYDITDGAPYLLSYTGEKEHVENENASFLSCNDTGLNHYLGMTLEVPFLQTERGRLPDGSAMTFEFSGDDDVWIFIDGVLVADLGGLHDAQELSINFADGTVSIPSLGSAGEHTLLQSFEAAEQPVDGFSGNTFADNTYHTLKMFYMERGHMASNLSLSFNVVVLEDPESNDPGGRDPGGSDPDGGNPGDDPENPTTETDNPEKAPGMRLDAKADSSAHPAESEQVKNAVGSPQTGDDSLIGWWVVLSLISLLGIGATVCNLVLVKSREKKRG